MSGLTTPSQTLVAGEGRNKVASLGSWIVVMTRWSGWARRHLRPARANANESRSSARNMGWTPLASLGGAIAAAVLLAGRVVPVVSPERNPEITNILLLLAYVVALLGTAMIGLGSILRFVRGYRAALGPLPAVLVAGAIHALPLDPVLHELDDRLHRSAREEIVRRLETGELARPQWYSAPPGRLVEAPQRGTLLIAVPPEFSAAVSNAGRQGLLQVTFDPALTRAVFQPHPGMGNRSWAVVYDHDDKAPEPGDLGLVWWRIQRVERLRANWYRIVAAEPLLRL